MGYFKRRVNRERSSRAVRAAWERADRDAMWTLWNGAPLVPERKWPYLRFSIREPHEDSHRRMGIFAAAGIIEDREDDCEARDELRHELDWFNEHLPVARIDEDAAIFFFKSHATECANRVWHLVRIVHENGFEVDLQRHENPGRVVYEDDYQVAVVPWASSGID